MILGCMHLNAAVFSQTINISERNVSLETVFSKIEKQSNYLFFYREELIKAMPNINISLKNVTVKEALDQFLNKLSLSYSIIGDNIVITSLQIKANSQSPAPKIYIGKVLDEKDQPMPGVSVRIKGTKSVVITNQEGQFITPVIDDDNAILQFSYIGYSMQEIPVSGLKAPIVVRLKLSSSDLDQVQILAYGTTTKRLNPGNTVTINAAEIAKHPVTNILQVIKDRVPGMFIEQRTGLPGGSFNVQIRGNNSFNNNIPLFVVDGVAYPGAEELPLVKPGGNRNQFLGGNALNYLNSNDIESVDILKDADATALYGSRGAYGVVLITTKRAKGGTPRLNVSTNTGVSMRPKTPEMLSLEDYLMLRREAFKNDGLTPGANDLDINGTWPEDRNTDWQKELLGKSALVNEVNMSYGGGAGNTNFLIGGNYKQEGSVQQGKGSNRGGTIRFNINNSTPNKKLFIDFGGSFSSTLNDAVPVDFSGDAGTLRAPNAPALFSPDGSLNWETGSNPYAALNLDYKFLVNNILSSSTLNYKPVKGLSLITRVSFNQLVGKEFRSTPSTFFDPARIATDIRNTTSFINNFTKRAWTLDPHAIYEIGISKKSKLTITTGATIQDQISTSSVITGTNFISDALLINPSLGSTVGSTYDAATTRILGFFGALNYNWADKYILSLNGRRDGSTKFGPGHRFGNFGSVAGVWIFSEENLLKENIPFLSLGKIRASYGLTGGDGISNYAYIPRYQVVSGTNTYQGNASFTPLSPVNRDLHYETNKKTDVQVILEFFKGRISLDGSYYKSHASDQLVQYPLASITGAIQYPSNSDVLIENTGYEFSINTKNIDGKDFKWSTYVGLTKAKNVLKSFPTLSNLQLNFNYEVGKSTQGLKLYTYAGVDPETGNYFFTTAGGVTGQNLFAMNQTTDRINFIDLAPKFYGIVTNSFTYKALTLDFSVSFRKRNGLNYLGQQQSTFGLFNTNSSVSVLDRWQNKGDVTDVPKISTNGLNSLFQQNNFRQSTGAYELITYARLQNMSMAYNFSPNVVRKLRVTNLSLYLRGENLLSASKYGDMDPESLSVTATPPLRVFTFGLNLTL
jgi:TonB-linked SusC/RagA family outer membrane protein